MLVRFFGWLKTLAAYGVEPGHRGDEEQGQHRRDDLNVPLHAVAA